MTDVLMEFPELKDPKTGESLMKRTVLIAKHLRYAGCSAGSQYLYRHYDSRILPGIWATASPSWRTQPPAGQRRCAKCPAVWKKCPEKKVIRRICPRGLLSSMNGPERSFVQGKVAGKAHCLQSGAVSPQGGDLSDPVAQATIRIVKVFWAWTRRWLISVTFPPLTGSTAIRSMTNASQTGCRRT